jgi:hypothetical protein
MIGDSTVMLKLPLSLKRSLKERALKMHRSLSSQIVHDLETFIEQLPPEDGRAKFMGLYEGTRVPTDAEILEVRSRMWGTLARKRR